MNLQDINKRIEELIKGIDFEEAEMRICNNCRHAGYIALPCQKHHERRLRKEIELKIFKEWKEDKENMPKKIENLTTFILSIDVRSKAETNLKLAIIDKIEDLKKELEK